jgi:acetyl-CoA C-acetyltransferase
VTRAQDEYAAESYRRSGRAQNAGTFSEEIVPVTIPGGKGIIVDNDEEITRVKAITLPSQRPAFIRDGSGTVTSGNSSSLNDGAAALVLMSETRARMLGTPILARVLGYGEAELASANFTTAPAVSIPRAIKHAGLAKEQIDLFEINEAFSVVALANVKLLELNPQRVNIYGGAVSIGHPLGCSGARILVTLLTALRKRSLSIGVAGICNGGGGSSSIVVAADKSAQLDISSRL